MTTEKNYIDASAIESVISSNAAGITVTVQKGFVKITAAKGINLYVAKQNRVGRIDLSGFTFDHPCVMAHSSGAFGAVEQEIDFSRPEPEVLECLDLIINHMKTLPERKIVRKARPKNDSLSSGWSPEFLSAASSEDSLPALPAMEEETVQAEAAE